MSRKFMIPFLTAAFLAAPAMLPSAFVSAIAPSLSGSAEARNTNVSRNTNVTRNRRFTTFRMGGGGGRSVSSGRRGALWDAGTNGRMGGGGGTATSGGGVGKTK